MATKEVKKEYYNQAASDKKINHRWWNVDKKQIHEHMFPLVGSIENRQQYRRAANVRHLRYYQNIDFMGIYSSMYSKTTQDMAAHQRISLNVVKSCTDTAASKIGVMRPRPMFLTEGGSWKMQKKAEQLNKFMDGTFDKMQIYQKKGESFVDSCIFGTGGVKFFINEDEKRVDCEKVMIDEIIVDDADAIYGSPRQLYQKRYVNRDVLIDMFPKHEAEIVAASGWKSGEVSSEASQELIPVIEGWHLPSGKKTKDGMRAICLSNVTLATEEWKYDWFPFSFDRWTTKRIGFFGMGLGEELSPIQLEINKILRTIQVSQHLMCVPRIWIDSRSAVNSQHFNNEIGAIGKYTGTPPTVTTSPGASPELFQHLQYLFTKAYEITGVSQMSAQAKKPAGLDSGVALREFQDIESERFTMNAKRYEQSFLDSASIVICLTRDLAKRCKDLSVRVDVRGTSQDIKWSDVEMEETDYIMRLFPTSILPTTPAGKLQTTQELVQAGFINQDMAVELLDFPDLKGAMNLRTAKYQIIRKMCDEMLDGGKYQPPEPFFGTDGLQLALELSQAMYLKAKMDGCPDDDLDKLRTYMNDVVALQQQAMPQPPMPPGSPLPPGGSGPQGVPAAPPVSDLMPNIPGAA